MFKANDTVLCFVRYENGELKLNKYAYALYKSMRSAILARLQDPSKRITFGGKGRKPERKLNPMIEIQLIKPRSK